MKELGGLSNLLDVLKVVHIVVQLLLAISFESLAWCSHFPCFVLLVCCVPFLPLPFFHACFIPIIVSALFFLLAPVCHGCTLLFAPLLC
jgi:hypothetical protein